MLILFFCSHIYAFFNNNIFFLVPPQLCHNRILQMTFDELDLKGFLSFIELNNCSFFKKTKQTSFKNIDDSRNANAVADGTAPEFTTFANGRNVKSKLFFYVIV
jgi:hypothetical protein